jgi:hypothetical protein
MARKLDDRRLHTCGGEEEWGVNGEVEDFIPV